MDSHAVILTLQWGSGPNIRFSCRVVTDFVLYLKFLLIKQVCTNAITFNKEYFLGSTLLKITTNRISASSFTVTSVTDIYELRTS